MILKILLIIGIIAIIYFVFTKKKSTGSKNNDTKPQANDMIECSNCGLYIEASETLLSNGKYYCSQECLNKDK